MLFIKENDARVGLVNALLMLIATFAVSAATWVYILEPVLAEADKNIKLQNQCIAEHIELGIERSRIVVTRGSCYVPQVVPDYM